MIVLSRPLVSPAMTIGLISAVVAIAIIIFAANVPIINAQQMTNQPTVSQNGTMLFQSTEDSFRLQVPDGWVIQDVNNTGSTLSNESTQGYAILAQLCPQEEQEEEEQAALSNVSGRGDTTTSCQGSEGDIIHIVRYPDLDTRLQVPNNITTNNGNLTIDNILSYHMQKLQEVGYRNITIVNSTYTAVNLTNPQTNQTVSIVPAQFVEIQYSSAAAAAVSSPNQIREGYFILTATNATAPNPGMTKGYSVFYEGTFTAPGAATVATIQETTATTATPSGSLEPTLSSALVRHMFESFELIAAPEVIQDMLAAQSEQAQEVPTSPLTVEITSSDTEGEAIAPATFEFEADVGGGTEPYTYSWDFDDESSEESDEQTVSHTFEEAGSYDVSLTVTDSGNQSASDSVEITVEEEEEEEEVEEEEPIPLLPPPTVEEEEEEEQEPISPAEEEVEEEVQEQRSLADEITENIEDEVDAFVDDFLSRYGVNN
jgi:PKD repeat protein